METINRYAHGTVWHWRNNSQYKAGVQAGDRPVLIISNNAFNKNSTVVNCVTITSVLKDSPVHVPLNVSRASHVQCEQIHTVTKDELSRYIGVVSNATLQDVKAKLRLQLGMRKSGNSTFFEDEKRNLERLCSIDNIPILGLYKTHLNIMLDKAEKGLTIPETESRILQLMFELNSHIVKVAVESLKLRQSHVSITDTSIMHAGESTLKRASLDKDSTVVKNADSSRKRYLEEDVKFITDENNSISMLMERYNFKDRASACKARSYLRKKETRDC